MNTELVTMNDENSLLPDVVNKFEDQFSEIVTASSFLPRLQLFASSSNAVKNEKVPMNNYALVSNKDEYDALGKEIDIAIISWRPRAIDASDKNNIRLSSDKDSDLFKEIRDRSDNEQNSGCMFGPEFLIWVPDRETFATLFCGSKTARNEASKIGKLMGKAATLKSKTIDNGTHTWQAIVTTPCTTPFMIPSKEAINAVAEDFLSPKEVLGAEKVQNAPNRVR